MALTLIKEDGTGKADANSYASAADGDAYHEGHLYATAWTGATSQKKDAALVFATRLIDAEFQFNGVKANETQALQWPREECRDPDAAPAFGGSSLVADNVVPKAVQQATCEMARELLVVDRTAAPTGEGIIATWTDTAGTKYCLPRDRRPVLTLLVQTMLAKYGLPVKRGNAAVRLVRA